MPCELHLKKTFFQTGEKKKKKKLMVMSSGCIPKMMKSSQVNYTYFFHSHSFSVDILK